MRTVRTDQVPAAQLDVPALRDVPGGDGDAVSVLPGIDHLVTLEHHRARLFGAGRKDGLQPRLRDEQPPAGADLTDALVQAGDDVGQLPAGQAVHHHDGAFWKELSL